VGVMVADSAYDEQTSDRSENTRTQLICTVFSGDTVQHIINTLDRSCCCCCWWWWWG